MVATDTPIARNWRPAFGYVVAASWLIQSLAIAHVLIVHPDQAGSVLSGASGLTALWLGAFGVMGLNVASRSRDKAVAAGQAGPGLIGTLAGAIAGGPERRP